MSEAVKQNQGELLFWRFAVIISPDGILKRFIGSGVVHHFPAVLTEDPVFTLPVLSELKALLQFCQL